MEGIGRAVVGLIGLLSATVGMFAFIPIAILLAVVSVAAVVGYRRGDYLERGSAWFLLVLPAIWILVGLWAGWWWRSGGPEPPEWVYLPVNAALIVEVVLAILLVWWLRGIRPVVATVALLNVYVTLSMTFLAGMAISGVWL
jgi:hypothetical protein